MTFKFTLSRTSKVLISSTVGIAVLFVGLDFWLNYQDRLVVKSHPWRIISVKSGHSLVVAQGNETKMVMLCGVDAVDDSSRKFLESVVDLGNGTVTLESVGNTHEAWILLDRDYDVELVKHISPLPNDLIGQQIHLNTWVIERGYSRRHRENSTRCLQPEHLAWAEQVAKKNNLGIWQGQ